MLTATRRILRLAVLPLIALIANPVFAADDKAQPDVIIFTNGDQLTGKFVNEIAGKVTFHSDVVGDITVTWDKVKELHTGQTVAVVNQGVKFVHHRIPDTVAIGTISVADQQITMVTLQPGTHYITAQPIPVKSAEYIVDQTTLKKQLGGEPGFFQAWNGTATAGLTLVQATQNQYTFNAAVALQRLVPTVSWLDPRNRTTVDYLQSYGKITDPSYTTPGGVFVPSTFSKSSIFHADAERDQYMTPRLYYLGQVAFDHNYSQSLDLQQIYGGGIGYTVIKTPKQELDVKATVQYERQTFFNTLEDEDKNLIGSTFGAYYTRNLTNGLIFTQQVLYLPAWNEMHAYSLSELNTLSMPVYKNFSFTVGTQDSYLNDVPFTLPPTKRNSFQFTAGVTYNIKSSY